MKNGLDDVDGSVQPPPSKRIKLEEDPIKEGGLLSKKRLGKGGQRKLPKSTLEERALILLNDDRVSAVEPQQVLCRMCGHWVKLFKHTDFSPANWRTHAEKCEPRTGWKARVQAEPGAAFTLTIPSLKPARPTPSEASASVSSSPLPLPPPTTPPLSKYPKAYTTTVSKAQLKDLLKPDMQPMQRRPTKSTAERQGALEKDTRCEVPGPHVVLCKMCGQWVKLHNTREYDLWNWLRHAEKCEIKNGWIQSGSATSQAPTSSSGVDGREDNCSITSSSIPELPEATQVQLTSRHAEKASIGPTTQTATVDTLTTRSPWNTSDSTSSRNPLVLTDLHLSKEPTANDERGKKTSQSLIVHESLSDIDAQRVDLTITPTSPTNRAGELQMSLGTRIRDEQSEQSSLVRKACRIEIGRAGANGDVLERTFEQAVPSIKAETGDLSELLYRDPAPEVGEEGMSISAQLSASTITKRRKGRNAEERRQALLNDSRAGEVLPNEVFCKMCNKWIKLYKDVDYVESNWVRHAERCSARQVSKNRPAASKNISTPLENVGARSTKDARKRAKGTDERLEELRADSRVAAIEPHQVLCDICNQWIKLQQYREYDVWNWRKHIPLCEQRHTQAQEDSSVPQPDLHAQATLRSNLDESRSLVKAEEAEPGPSSAPTLIFRLAGPPKLTSTVKVKDESTPEQRRAELERDGRCENIEPQRVTCKICDRTVGLHVKKDYSLSNWYRHISSCGKKVDKSAKAPPRTPLSAIAVPRPAEVPTDPSSSTPTAAATATAPDQPGPALVDGPSTTSDAEVQLVVSAPAYLGKATKSTAEERRTKILADPRVGALEPNRIQCKLCQHWLKLNEFMEYAPYNWYKHIERCEIRTSLKVRGTLDAPIAVKKEEPQTMEVQTLPEMSISAEVSKRKRSTALERLERMQADPRIRTIEKHRARCGLCNKWVKLQNKTQYDPHNWFAHIKKCTLKSKEPELGQPSAADTPETRETSPTIYGDSDSASFVVERTGNTNATDRRTLLLNDARSAAVEPHRVLCGICHQWIKLRDGKDYVPYNWFKHKRKCERKNRLPQTPIPSMSSNEDRVSAHALVKEVVKKEAVSVDLLLYNNDTRKMSDQEREDQLCADPRLGDVESGRVFCKMCNNWIRLNMSTGFLRGNWLRHAERCKGKATWEGVTPDAHEEPPELRAVEIIDLDESENSGDGHFGFIELAHLIGNLEPTISSTDYGRAPEDKSAPVVAKQPPTWSMPTLRARTSTPTLSIPAPLSQSNSEPKLSDSGKRMHRSEDSRKQELENDPRTKIVRPDKILCAMCDRWIQMRRDVSYSPQNWLKHAGICEQRTGWLKRRKAEKPENDEKPSQPVTRDPSEEPVPYNARVRVNERHGFEAPPALKPVDWDQVIYSDEDDEDENTVVGDGLAASQKPEALATSVQKGSSVPGPGHTMSISATASASTTTGVPSTGNAQRLALPTPLTSLATRIETKTPSTSASVSTGPRKPQSISPPMVIQHGYATNKDGMTLKPGQNQNGGAQRPVPFVVPASSMLPHLLPRPMLVPISHAAGQRSAIPSPFRIPATPPLPTPVGPTKRNGTMSTPPLTVSAAKGAAKPQPSGSPASTTSVIPRPTSRVTAEPSGVAVPTPVRSVLKQTTITVDPIVNKSTTIPPADTRNRTRKESYGPVGPGVLQLAPDPAAQTSSSTREKDTPPTLALAQAQALKSDKELAAFLLWMHG